MLTLRPTELACRTSSAMAPRLALPTVGSGSGRAQISQPTKDGEQLSFTPTTLGISTMDATG